MQDRILRKAAAVGLGVALVLSVATVGGEYLGVRGLLPRIPAGLDVLVMVPIMLFCLSLEIGLIVIVVWSTWRLVRGRRWTDLHAGAIALAGLVALALSARLQAEVRLAAFRTAAERLTPFVEAVERFQSAHSRTPDTNQELGLVLTDLRKR